MASQYLAPATSTVDDDDDDDASVSFITQHRAKILVCGLLGVLLGIILLAVLLVTSKADSQVIEHLEEEVDIVDRDCGVDDFGEITYDVGTNTRRLRYKLVDTQMNFKAAKSDCVAQNSTLWEVLDGAFEYNRLYAQVSKQGATTIWMNGVVVGSCSGGTWFCHKEESKLGKGLAVKWPSTPRFSFSKLYSGATADLKCVLVEGDDPDRLWITGSCENDKHKSVCVKRDCLPKKS